MHPDNGHCGPLEATNYGTGRPQRDLIRDHEGAIECQRTLEELERCANANYKYDFAQAARILEAMDALRQEAVKTHIPEIVTMIDAACRILVTTYYSILRYEMTKMPGTEE